MGVFKTKLSEKINRKSNANQEVAGFKTIATDELEQINQNIMDSVAAIGHKNLPLAVTWGDDDSVIATYEKTRSLQPPIVNIIDDGYYFENGSAQVASGKMTISMKYTINLRFSSEKEMQEIMGKFLGRFESDAAPWKDMELISCERVKDNRLKYIKFEAKVKCKNKFNLTNIA